MQREYLLQGLDCANCASKIENALKSMDQIISATVSFMTTTLKIETKDNYRGDLTKDVERIVHKLEPDISVVDKTEAKKEDSHDHASEGKSELIMLIIGAIIFGAGMVFERMGSISEYISIVLFVVSYLILGGKVVLRALRNITRGQIFDENFLMSIATIGAFIIGQYAEAVGVMLFYQVGEFFQSAAVRRSKKSIT